MCSDDDTQRRHFFVLNEPLGVLAPPATLTCHANQLHVLEADGSWVRSSLTKRQVVGEALFGDGAVRGYGNVWTGKLVSRQALVVELEKDDESSATGIEKRKNASTRELVSCLRGLLGTEPRDVPRNGRLWKKKCSI